MKYSELPVHEDNESKIRTYRRFAGINEEYEITEENIDESALGMTCAYVNESFSDVKNILLGRQ